VESHLQWHGLDPKTSLVTVKPKEGGQRILTHEQIIQTIDENASSAAMILLSGVQFYTGQLFDIQAISSYAKTKGLVVGWDFAHAAGNVILQLHDWDIDFAAWCTYKYLNAGPGGIASIFVHQRYGTDWHRLAGWWGHDKDSRFQMENSELVVDGLY